MAGNGRCRPPSLTRRVSKASAIRNKTIPFKGEPRLMRPGQTMTIGNTGAGEFMDGVIDDVRIWKHALTDQQVRSLIAP